MLLALQDAVGPVLRLARLRQGRAAVEDARGCGQGGAETGGGRGGVPAGLGAGVEAGGVAALPDAVAARRHLAPRPRLRVAGGGRQLGRRQHAARGRAGGGAARGDNLGGAAALSLVILAVIDVICDQVTISHLGPREAVLAGELLAAAEEPALVPVDQRGPRPEGEGVAERVRGAEVAALLVPVDPRHLGQEAGGGAGEVPGAVGRILYTQAGRQNRHQQHNGGKKHCRCCVTSRYLFEISI